MKGVFNMSLKKGIISISTIAVVVLGVFFTVRFIGGREDASNVKVPNNSVVENNTSTSTDNNEVVTNTDAKEKSSNEMDATYINDKTSVGIYTVKEDDTVFSIVKTHMPSFDKNKIVEFIKNRNNMNETYKISKGDKIVIPYEKAIKTSSENTAKTSSEVSATVDTQKDISKYTVKKQDTLTSIAKDNMPSYNVKEAITMLKETNKITDENAIKDGMIITIPKK
jgi:hypothetical protein